MKNQQQTADKILKHKQPRDKNSTFGRLIQVKNNVTLIVATLVLDDRFMFRTDVDMSAKIIFQEFLRFVQLKLSWKKNGLFRLQKESH